MANLATMLIGLERFTSGLKRRVIQVGDHRIVYSEGGQGEPVVLLHGFGASADSWNRFAKPLTKRYHVIAPDQAGLGRKHPARKCILWLSRPGRTPASISLCASA